MYLALKLVVGCSHLAPECTESGVTALMLGKIEGKRRRGGQRMRRLDVSLSKLWEIVKDRVSLVC